MKSAVKNEDATDPEKKDEAGGDAGGSDHTDPVALDPCPFCGSSDLDEGGEQIKCSNCQAVGPVAGSGMDARGAWNSRKSDEAAPDMGDVPTPEADPSASAAKFKNVTDARTAFVKASIAHFKAHGAAVKFAKQAEELATVRAIAAEVVTAKAETAKNVKALADYKAGEPKRVTAAATRILAASGHPPVEGEVVNPVNGGASNKGGKEIPRAEFEKLSVSAKAAHFRARGTVTA